MPKPRRVLSLSAALLTLAYAGYRYTYLYGMDHCCDLGLYNELARYAADHDGWFPRGEATPEASLSLLYRQDPANAYNLRGKSVPESVVLQRLARGDLLTPETCGWHYVEGLRVDDDPRLALFWDKAGLDHFSARLSNGGHWLIKVDGDIAYIPESDWTAFLQEQEHLLKERADGTEPRADAQFEFQGKLVHVQLRVVTGRLSAATWINGSKSSRIALTNVADEPHHLGDVPEVSKDEIRKARVVIDPKKAASNSCSTTARSSTRTANSPSGRRSRNDVGRPRHSIGRRSSTSPERRPPPRLFDQSSERRHLQFMGAH
jgi:hypothetical protein